jgi:hypothetical protein
MQMDLGARVRTAAPIGHVGNSIPPGDRRAR